MNWEALIATGSILSAIVIAASAALALRQVNQLRRATQLDGTMRIFAQFTDPAFIEARNFVLADLEGKLKDPVFVQELQRYASVDLSRHPEYRVLMFLQLVGALVKNHLIDGPGVYEFAQYSIVKSWEHLREVVRLQRRGTDNPYMWETAEYLYENARQWVEKDAKVRGLLRPTTGEPFAVEHFQ